MYPNSMRFGVQVSAVVSDDDLRLPINTHGSHTYLPRRVSARCVSDLAIYIRSYTKLKIQTSNRLSKTFYERLPAKLLSHNNPFITKHSPYMRKYIMIHYVYRVGLSDFIYIIYTNIC